MLLNEIVAIHQLRILGRLRSKHALSSIRSKGPPIIIQLQEAVNRAGKSEKGKPDFKKLYEVVSNLLHHFNDLEKLSKADASSTSGSFLLQKIIRVIYLDIDFSVLVRVLSGISSKDSPWPGTPCDQVPRRFWKVSQYVSAAKYLRRMVRKHPSWEIEEVNNGPFKERPNGPELNGTVGLLTRSITNGTKPQRKEFKQSLEARLNDSYPRIEKDIREITELDSRVHAEVQLVYHYAQDFTGALPPRIICSNKEACYLCDLYLKIHGVFTTPRSHGRVYPQWRLPGFDEVQLSKRSTTFITAVTNRFNQAIEARISLFLRQKAQKRRHPSESTVFRLGSEAATTISAPSSGRAVTIERRSTLLSSLSADCDSPIIVLNSEEPEAVPSLHASSLHATTSSGSSLSSHPSVIDNSQGPECERILQVQQTACTTTENREPHLISYGSVAEVDVYPGCSVRFHSPTMHIEFIYEDPEHPNEINSSLVKDKVVVRIEWLLEQPKHGQIPFDLSTPPPESCEIPFDQVLDERGVVIRGRDCMFAIQASKIELQDEGSL